MLHKISFNRLQVNLLRYPLKHISRNHNSFPTRKIAISKKNSKLNLENKCHELCFFILTNMLRKLLIILLFSVSFLCHLRHCYMEKGIRARSENFQKTFQRTDSKRLSLVCTLNPIFLT